MLSGIEHLPQAQIECIERLLIEQDLTPEIRNTLRTVRGGAKVLQEHIKAANTIGFEALAAARDKE